MHDKELTQKPSASALDLASSACLPDSPNTANTAQTHTLSGHWVDPETHLEPLQLRVGLGEIRLLRGTGAYTCIHASSMRQTIASSKASITPTVTQRRTDTHPEAVGPCLGLGEIVLRRQDSDTHDARQARTRHTTIPPTHLDLVQLCNSLGEIGLPAIGVSMGATIPNSTGECSDAPCCHPPQPWSWLGRPGSDKRILAGGTAQRSQQYSCRNSSSQCRCPNSSSCFRAQEIKRESAR